jgi:hypothetical protein
VRSCATPDVKIGLNTIGYAKETNRVSLSDIEGHRIWNVLLGHGPQRTVDGRIIRIGNMIETH